MYGLKTEAVRTARSSANKQRQNVHEAFGGRVDLQNKRIKTFNMKHAKRAPVTAPPPNCLCFPARE